MDAPIAVIFRDMPALPLVEAAMRQRAAEIVRRFPAVLGIRLVVDAEGNRFLTDHDYVVTATAHLHEGPLVVGEHRRHPDLASAIECSFAALTGRLEQRFALRPTAPTPAWQPRL